MQLNLPAKNQQPEKHHSVLLMLTASFRCCSGLDECKDTKPCFACHDLILQHQKRYIRGTYITRWKRLKARMQILNQSAMERSMASLSIHSVQDLIGMREWFPSMATNAKPDERQEHLDRKTEARFRMWFLKHMVSRYRWKHAEDPFAGADLPRIHERIAAFLEGAYVGFHYGQLTPQEFYAMVSDTWLRRYVSFHEARATSSSQRRAERFRYMGVSTETNAICHDVMFCRPAAPTSIESNELEHPQRVQSKSAETAGRPLPRQGRRSSKIKEEPCRKLGHATLRLPTFRYTI